MNRIGKTIRHHILRLFHLKKAKTLPYSVILKYIQGLNFNKRKTEDQILASLSTLELDKFLKYNDNYDSYSLLISVKELENEISEQPTDYANNPELLKYCGTLNSELDIGKLEDLLLKQIKIFPRSLNDLINLVKQKGFTNPEQDIIIATTNLQLDKKIFHDESADRFFVQKKIEPKSERIVFQLKCQHCDAEPEFHSFKKETKRKHTSCKKCGRNIEINKKTIWDPLKEIKKSTIPTQRIVRIHDLDKKILEIIKDPSLYHMQKDIAKICQKNCSTISRHLAKLENSGLVIRISKNPSFYHISKSTKATEDIAEKANTDLNFTTTHGRRVYCYLLRGTIKTNFPKNNLKFNNSPKYYFYEKGLEITLTRGKKDSLIFWPLGAGFDPDDALDNFHYKTKEILEHLETKYDLDISNPTYWNLNNKKNPHMVPASGDESDYENFREAWSDKSHEGAIETTSKEIVRKVLKVADTFPTFIKELDKQKQEVYDLKNNSLERIDVFKLRDIIMDKIDSKLTIFENQLTIDLSTKFAEAVGFAMGDALQKYI